ncbi:hypothetical protein OG447_24990 [Streptomyces sp. NBC_01408]|nr:hypothetical protein [Streptomyces sp. NBC_01408]
MHPGVLALVTVLSVAEALSDRQETNAVRMRTAWKRGRGPDLTDTGFSEADDNVRMTKGRSVVGSPVEAPTWARRHGGTRPVAASR